MVHIRAKAVGDGVGTNSVGLFAYNFESNRVDPKPENDYKQVKYRVRPAPDTSVAVADAAGVAGSASASAAARVARAGAGTPVARRATRRARAGVKRVDVAILRLGKGLKALDGQAPPRPTHKPGKCEWLNGKVGGFAKRKATKGVCDSPVWIRVVGTKHWSLELKHDLPKGSYVVYSRATDTKGVSESNFTARDGNRKTFRVK